MSGGTKRVHADEIKSESRNNVIPPRKRIKKIDLYDHALRTVKDNAGRVISEFFLRTPSRRIDAEYYKKVDKPIDFSRIQQKIKSGDYLSFKDLCADIELLINNAKLFYEENSVEFACAKTLFEIYEDTKERIIHDDSFSMHSIKRGNKKLRASPSPSSQSKSSGKRTPTPNRHIEDWRMEAVIASLLQLTDSENRLICPPFRLLDPPEEFPDYYEKIKNPIDLKTICKRIRSHFYSSWILLESDIKLMCHNAKKFNVPGSRIFQDADILYNHFNNKMRQVAECLKLSSKEISINAQHLDNLIRSSDSEANEYTEDSEEDEDSETDPDPKWILYWKIRNYEVRDGVPACEPFLELPSKRSYTDYYEEIKSPMSLFMINKKLKRGEYRGVKEIAEDLILIFDNACLYNMDQSPIYRSAQKLKSLTKATFDELLKEAQKKDVFLESNVNNCKMEMLESEESKTESTINDFTEKHLANDISSEQHMEQNNHNQDNSNSVFISPETSFSVKEEQSTDFASSEKPKRVRRLPGDPPGRKGRPPKNKSEFEFNSVHRAKPGRKSFDELKEKYTQKLLTVWKTVRELKVGTRLLSEPFLYLPCDKAYPDYYSLIKNPIDLTTIYSNIRERKYGNSQEMITDLNLMFSNSRKFNRPGSQIYTDTSILESVANSTMNSVSNNAILYMPENKKDRKPTKNKDATFTTLIDGITKPNCSKHSDELPHSFIHLDASVSDDLLPPEILTLLEKPDKRLELLEKCKEQRQMQSIFEELLQFRDEDGRVLAEWFICLPTEEEEFYKEYYNVIKKPMDLTRVANKLNSNQYDLWRQLIDDLKLVFENACKFNEPESQIYKDSLSLLGELMHLKLEFFNDNDLKSVQIQLRQILHQLLETVNNYKNDIGVRIIDSIKSVKGYESLTRNGHFTIEEIQANLARGRYRRLDRFQEDLFFIFSWSRQNCEIDSSTFLDSIEFQKHIIARRDELCKDVLLSPAMLFITSQLDEEIENLKKERKRKVLDAQSIHSLESIKNNLCSKINSTSSFESTENIQTDPQKSLTSCDEVDFVRPMSPLDITREEVLLQRQPTEIDLGDHPSCSFGNIYYQQIEHNGRFYRLGDGVLVYRDGKPYCDIVRIDRLWKAESGIKMFSGCRFARPHEIKHEPSRMFYRREVFGVKEIDVVETIENIQGKCAILTVKQAESCRPTEISECDVFIVDQKVLGYPIFDEHGNKIPLSQKNCSLVNRSNEVDELDACNNEMDLDNAKPLRKLKRYHFSLEVAEDEIYYFKNPIVMDKMLSPLIIKTDSNLPVGRSDLDAEEQHLNGVDASEDSKFLPVTPTPSVEGTVSSTPPATPSCHQDSRNALFINGVPKDAQWLASQPKLNSKSKSGYILFSAEVRKRVMNEHPESDFGEISRLVGVEWKKLSSEQKRQYETRAQIIAEERTKAELNTPNSKILQPGQIRVYCCKWNQCDFQFNSLDGLLEHVKSSHTPAHELSDEFACMWQSCLKYRKEGKPFPSLPRLLRHIREKHMPSSSKAITPDQRTKNFFTFIPRALPPVSGSSHKKEPNEIGGLFIHEPYGRSHPNAAPHPTATLLTEQHKSPIRSQQACTSATPTAHRNSMPATPAMHHVQPPTPVNHGHTMVHRVPQSTPISAVLNGVHASGATHYIVQQPQVIQQTHQTVMVPTALPLNNSTPVQHMLQANIGGTTVYLPTGAQYQTVILNPSVASGSSGAQQIILHPTSSASNVPHHSSHYVQHHSQSSQMVGHHHHQQTFSNHHHQHQIVPVSSGDIPTLMATEGPGTSNSSHAVSHSTNVSSVASTLPPPPHILPPTAHHTTQSNGAPRAQSNAHATSTAQHPPQHMSVLQTPPFDSGRAVVTAARPPEPVFIASTSNPTQVRRVLHSEAYVKYIESMYKSKQKQVSKWDRTLSATSRNTVTNHKKLPHDWIEVKKSVVNGVKNKEDDYLRAFWKLREQMLDDEVSVDRNLTSEGNCSFNNQQS